MVGVGTVIIVYIGVAYTKGGGGTVAAEPCDLRHASVLCIAERGARRDGHAVHRSHPDPQHRAILDGNDRSDSDASDDSANGDATIFSFTDTLSDSVRHSAAYVRRPHGMCRAAACLAAASPHRHPPPNPPPPRDLL